MQQALNTKLQDQQRNLAPSSVDKQSNAVSQISALIADDMQQVNTLILEHLHSDVALIPQLARYLIAAGGKRIRPMLTLACAQLCGYQGTRHQGLACCVEFIHTATLLHDDVVDQSDQRRGQDSANAIWGNQASVLVGDFLFSRAFELMVKDGSLEVLAILSKASATIAEGEVEQLSIVNDLSINPQRYFSVIAAKTAALFAAACEVAAVIARESSGLAVDAEQQGALRDYGRYLGIAFQLVDDALDYKADQAKLGKNIGDDFREGKMTLPVLLAYEKANSDERAFWIRTMEKLEQEPSDLDQAIAILESHQAIALTLEEAARHIELAKQALDLFDNLEPAQRQMKQALCDLAQFCLERSH